MRNSFKLNCALSAAFLGFSSLTFAQTADQIADLKGVSIEALAEQTSSNFFQCFHINRTIS